MKFWLCVALVSAIVAAAHSAVVVKWAALRDVQLARRVDDVRALMMAMESRVRDIDKQVDQALEGAAE